MRSLNASMNAYTVQGDIVQTGADGYGETLSNLARVAWISVYRDWQRRMKS
jgi:hypothetical protein